jgi:hypothetical protein
VRYAEIETIDRRKNTSEGKQEAPFDNSERDSEKKKE